jgi:hypothetical protein
MCILPRPSAWPLETNGLLKAMLKSETGNAHDWLQKMTLGARLRHLARMIERHKRLNDEDRIDIISALSWAAVLADNSAHTIKEELP